MKKCTVVFKRNIDIEINRLNDLNIKLKSENENLRKSMILLESMEFLEKDVIG